MDSDDFDPRLAGGSLLDSDGDEPEAVWGVEGPTAPLEGALDVGMNPALMDAYRAARRAQFEPPAARESLDDMLERLRAALPDFLSEPVAVQVPLAKRPADDELDAALDRLAWGRLESELESGPGASDTAVAFVGGGIAALHATGFESSDDGGRPSENPATDLAVHNARVDGGLAADPERAGAEPGDAAADGAFKSYSGAGSGSTADADPKVGWLAELRNCENELGRILAKIDSLTSLIGSH